MVLKDREPVGEPIFEFWGQSIILWQNSSLFILSEKWISLFQKDQQFWGPWILGTALLNVYSHERIFKNMVHKDLWLVLNSHIAS